MKVDPSELNFVANILTPSYDLCIKCSYLRRLKIYRTEVTVKTIHLGIYPLETLQVNPLSKRKKKLTVDVIFQIIFFESQQKFILVCKIQYRILTIQYFDLAPRRLLNF